MLVVNQNKAGIIRALEKMIKLDDENVRVGEIMLKEVDGESIPPEFAEDLLRVKIRKRKKSEA